VAQSPGAFRAAIATEPDPAIAASVQVYGKQLRTVGREVLKRRDGREEWIAGCADMQLTGASAGRGC